MSATFATEVGTLLRSLRRPGTFAFGGTRAVEIPRIEVAGVGLLGFPVPVCQAERLKARAEPAPYGRGAETIVDPTVRRAWQVAADQVRVDDRWQAVVAAVVAEVRVGLAVEAAVEAQLYKLMIYDEGCFFLGHRDSAKVEGMFGTLVVVLPSPFEGGALVVSHRGETARLPLQAGFSEIAWGAFYADCEHRLEPITAGHRLALIYHLVRGGRGAPPRVADNQPEEARLAGLLAAEGKLLDDLELDRPVKRVFPLAHRYVAPELSCAALKGEDRAAAAVLVGAAQAAGWAAHLAVVTIEQTGWAEVTHSRYGVEHFEIGEVTEETRSVGDWRAVEGPPPFTARLPLEDGELCPPNGLEDAEPDELEYSEASGNEGASFERAWRRAALVFWPERHVIDVLEAGGAMPMVEVLATWSHRFAEGETALAGRAHALAGRLLRHLPGVRRYPDPGPLAGVISTFESLVRLGNEARIAQLIRGLAGSPKWHISGNGALVAALDALSPTERAELVALVVEAHIETRPAIGIDLLDRLRDHQVPDILAPAVAVLVQRSPAQITEATAALVRVLDTLVPGEGEAVIERWLAVAGESDFDRHLRPAVLALGTRPGRAFARLFRAVVDHLEARLALPLVAPPDQTREATLTCRCQDCTAFNAFLVDPVQTTWRLKAAQAHRSHVESGVSHHPCDVDLHTDSTGRPHSLVAHKNQASYLKRCRQRTQDQAERAKLAALAANTEPDSSHSR